MDSQAVTNMVAQISSKRLLFQEDHSCYDIRNGDFLREKLFQNAIMSSLFLL